MREIVLPDYVQRPPTARYMAFVVKVDWPEVQLTDQQAFDNSMARQAGLPPPHEDHSLIRVLVPYPSNP